MRSRSPCEWARWKTGPALSITRPPGCWGTPSASASASSGRRTATSTSRLCSTWGVAICIRTGDMLSAGPTVSAGRPPEPRVPQRSPAAWVATGFVSSKGVMRRTAGSLPRHRRLPLLAPFRFSSATILARRLPAAPRITGEGRPVAAISRSRSCAPKRNVGSKPWCARDARRISVKWTGRATSPWMSR